MDSINIHGIKVEKANAIFRYDKITTAFRFMELCVFLILLSRFSFQLPFAVKLSGEYFKGLFVTLISPRFVFIVGNAIIVILFLKSGQLSAKDVYDEYNENCRKNQRNGSYENRKQTNRKHITSCDDHKKRKIHRSQSENMEKMQPRRELRRSVTERCRKSVIYGKKPDEMSSEDFRRTVEAFIARQQRLLREEEEEEVFSTVV